MGWKDYFKLTWPIFILFLVFNYLARTGFLQIKWEIGILDPFSFFNQFMCSSTTSLCNVFEPTIALITIIPNMIWQFFLANLVMIIYYKIKN